MCDFMFMQHSSHNDKVCKVILQTIHIYMDSFKKDEILDLVKVNYSFL